MNSTKDQQPQQQQRRRGGPPRPQTSGAATELVQAATPAAANKPGVSATEAEPIFKKGALQRMSVEEL